MLNSTKSKKNAKNIKQDVIVQNLTENIPKKKYIRKKKVLNDDETNDETLEEEVHEIVQEEVKEVQVEVKEVQVEVHVEVQEEVQVEVQEEVKEEVKEETETTLQLKGKEVRTFDKETTLVIVGDYNDDSSDFSITDDETEFGVYIGDKEHSTSYESDGFVSILTLDEFKNWRKKIENNGNHMDDILGSSFLIPDFKGTIGVTAKTSNNEFTTDFYIEDYICHQVDNCYDVYLTLPEGTTIIEMENHEIPLSVLRDLKIDKIIE